MMQVRFQGEAEQEFEDAVAWHNDEYEGRGTRLRSDIEEAVQFLRQFPYAAPSIEGTPFRKWTLQRFPYVLFFEIRDDVIWIMAVAHGKRRPGYWMDRTID